MSRWGIDDARGRVIANLPYAAEIAAGCDQVQGGFPFAFLYAIKVNETGWNPSDPPTQQSTNGDGGFGLFQFTPSESGIALPDNWQDPKVAAYHAIVDYLLPEVGFWLERIPGIEGSTLVKCMAAGYNAGDWGAWRGHVDSSSVDEYDTDQYGARAQQVYQNLIDGKAPD